LTYNKSIVDKIWNFFSSVKVGVSLIAITFVSSALGTVFPQEMYIPADALSRDPAIFYEEQYGILVKLYYLLGYYNLFSSCCYIILIGLIGISIIIASIDQFYPMHKALKMQKAKRHETFMKRQRLFSETKEVADDEKQKIVEGLKKQRYK